MEKVTGKKGRYIIQFISDDGVLSFKQGEIELTVKRKETVKGAIERYENSKTNEIKPIPENWDYMKIYKLVKTAR